MKNNQDILNEFGKILINQLFEVYNASYLGCANVSDFVPTTMSKQHNKKGKNNYTNN
jgi:hypothetical protein